MKTTKQDNERAMIYDYRTGEEIRQATAEEEQRYIAQLLKLTGNQRTIGAVDGNEYDHDGSIYMQGGRVEIAAGSLTTTTSGRLWSGTPAGRTSSWPSPAERASPSARD